MSKLVLKVAGTSYTGFESVHIHRSMFNICNAFVLSIENFFHRDSTLPIIKMGSSAKLEINDTVIIDGYIDKLEPEYGSNYDNMVISGRDKTCDLVDCEYDSLPNEWKNQTILTLIKNLCQPFGITVTVDASATANLTDIIETYKAKEGMKISDLINELCRDAGIFPMSIGDGKLTLSKASTTNVSVDGIAIGKNMRSGKALFNDCDRFSSYTVKGQGVSTDNKILKDYISCNGSYLDTNITRTRSKILFAEGITNNSRCKKKAISEARLAAGMSRFLMYNINEWVQSNDKPWKINHTVRVKDDFAQIDRTMLIFAIDNIYDEEDGGDITTLYVIDKEAFSSSAGPIRISTKFD